MFFVAAGIANPGTFNDRMEKLRRPVHRAQIRERARERGDKIGAKKAPDDAGAWVVVEKKSDQ
jgi:hypothetical protein